MTYTSNFLKTFKLCLKFILKDEKFSCDKIGDILDLACNFNIDRDLFDLGGNYINEISEEEFYLNINSYDNSLDSIERENTGSYYTPINIAENMCKDVLKYFKYEDIRNLKVIDISCGSCNFILGYIRSVPAESLEIATSNIFAVDIQNESLILGGLLLIYELHKITGEIFLNVKLINEDTIMGDNLEKNKSINMIMKSGGFDIVIGNPPYLGEKGNQKKFESIKNEEFGMKYYEGKMDLFYFFIHKGIDILKPNGIISFITTNYFVTSDGGKKLRKRLKDSGKFLEIFDFGETKLFKSALGQHNMIFIYSKNDGSEKGNVKIGFSETSSTYEIEEKKIYDDNDNIRYYDKINTFTLIEKILSVSNEKIADKFDVKQGIVSAADTVTKSILKKIDIKVIEENNIKINDGIFVHEKKEIDDFQFENEYVKDFYKNSDIKPYYNNDCHTNLCILYINSKVKDESIPNIKKYLLKYKKILDARREVKKGYIPWYSLQWSRDIEIFKNYKIILPQRNISNVFSYCDKEFFGSADIYYIVKKNEKHVIEELKYLVGLLNSKLYYFWLYNMGKRKGNLLELYSTPIKEVRYIKYENFDWQNKIINIVNDFINEDNKDHSHVRDAIEELINFGYSLSNLEIEEIKNFYNFYTRR